MLYFDSSCNIVSKENTFLVWFQENIFIPTPWRVTGNFNRVGSFSKVKISKESIKLKWNLLKKCIGRVMDIFCYNIIQEMNQESKPYDIFIIQNYSLFNSTNISSFIHMNG